MADIKINADVSSVKKSLQEITQSAKALGKSPIDLLSPQTVKMLQGEANAQLGELQNKAKSLRTEMEAQARAVDKAARGTQKYAQEMAKLANLSKQVSANQAQQGAIRGGFGGGGAAGGGFTGGGRGGGGLLGRFGGIGGIAKGAAGLAGGALVAGGGAALAYGAGRVLAGHQKYQAGIGQRIQLRGLGQNPAIQDSQRAAAAGLDQGELRGRRIQDIRALGSAAGGESGTLKRAEYERSFGLEGGTLSSLAGQTKGAVGGKAAAADIQKTLESAVSAGLQDADIGSYLETAVGLLQNIDSSGIKDRSAMLQALSDVTRATKDSPEQMQED